MKAYAVTIEGEKVNLVGLFCAKSIKELAELVDEICDTTDVLYAEVKTGGGVIWWRNNHHPLAGAEMPVPDLTEHWRGIAIDLMSDRGPEFLGSWKPFPREVRS